MELMHVLKIEYFLYLLVKNDSGYKKCFHYLTKNPELTFV